MTEQSIQNSIIKYLESIGAYVRKNIASNRAGTPDITGCLDGRYIAIEVKRPGKQLTKLQEHNLKLIREAGGLAERIESTLQLRQWLSNQF